MIAPLGVIKIFLYGDKKENMANQNEAIFAYIDDITSTHNLTHEDVANILVYALTKAYNKIYTDKNIDINVDFKNKTFQIKEKLEVVDDKYYEENGNDDCEIPLSEAKKFDSNAEVGDNIIKNINPKSFEPTMIRNVLQLFKQRVSETINEKIYNQWKDKKGTIISGKVETNDPVKNFSFVEFGTTKGFVSASDKIPGENLEIDKTYKFFVKDVREQTKGWPIILSRTDPGFIKDLVKLEVPEVAQDIVVIQDIARIPGFKTKIAVKSNNPSIDPVTTCIGQRRSRVDSVSREINNLERIEFIRYYDDPIKYIASACLPSRIDGIDIISKEEKSATIVAPKESLSLIIGVRGKNISLISKLTGWNLDVKNREDARKENIDFEPIDLTFYERGKSNKTFAHQFASTNEILKNLEHASSYEQIEKTFELKDNEALDTSKKFTLEKAKVNKAKTADNEVNNEQEVENKENNTQVQEEQPVIDAKELQDMLNSNIQTNPKSINNDNKTTKIDYTKLKNNSNSGKLNHLESIFDEKKTEKKTNNKNTSNKNNQNDKAKKKTNILDEFDDVTQDYLMNDDTEYNDDNDSYDDYDLDDEYDE